MFRRALMVGVPTAAMAIGLYACGGNDDGSSSQSIQNRAVTATPIKRSEFGLVWSKSVEAVSMIGEDVIIEMDIEAARVP